MTQKRFTSLLLLFIFAIATSAAPIAVPVSNTDAGAVTAVGQGTLVVWTNMAGIESNSVYMRFLESPFDRNAILLGPGAAPRVTTNGDQFLIGYMTGGSRFNTGPYDNVGVQLVSPEGIAIGPRRILNRSLFGVLIDVASNGKHWLVAYHSEHGAYVAFLDHGSLDVVARLQVGTGAMLALEEIGGRRWAIHGDSISAEAVELRDDGTAGARFPTAPLGHTIHITHGVSPLVLMQNGDDVDAVPFDPFQGFGERRTLLKATRLVDIEADDTGSLLLVARSNTHYDTISLNTLGEIQFRAPLVELPTLPPYTMLGQGKNGLLLFTTPLGDVPGAGDLYSYRIDNFCRVRPCPASIDLSSVRLVSQMGKRVRQRSARH